MIGRGVPAGAQAPPLKVPLRFEYPASANVGTFGSEGYADFATMPAPMPGTTPSGDTFTAFDESPVKVVAEQPVSTFSIDVDTASYSYVRSMLADGYAVAASGYRQRGWALFTARDTEHGRIVDFVLSCLRVPCRRALV